MAKKKGKSAPKKAAPKKEQAKKQVARQVSKAAKDGKVTAKEAKQINKIASTASLKKSVARDALKDISQTRASKGKDTKLGDNAAKNLNINAKGKSNIETKPFGIYTNNLKGTGVKLTGTPTGSPGPTIVKPFKEGGTTTKPKEKPKPTPTPTPTLPTDPEIEDPDLPEKKDIEEEIKDLDRNEKQDIPGRLVNEAKSSAIKRLKIADVINESGKFEDYVPKRLKGIDYYSKFFEKNFERFGEESFETSGRETGKFKGGTAKKYRDKFGKLQDYKEGPLYQVGDGKLKTYGNIQDKISERIEKSSKFLSSKRFQNLAASLKSGEDKEPPILKVSEYKPQKGLKTLDNKTTKTATSTALSKLKDFSIT